MNGLGLALAWLSVTVTVVIVTALVLERVVSRRGPRAGSWVAAASLAVMIVLTPLAFCPVPTLSTWRPPASSGEVSPAVFEGSAPLIEPGSRDGAISASLATKTGVATGGYSWRSLSRRLGAGLAWGSDSLRQRHAALPTAWCVVVLVGTSCCLVRLVLGLWGVSDCRRKSTAIGDADLVALVDILRRALGVVRPIEVRELPDMSWPSAAAVGWLRPLVLLPGNWRSWSDSERRAVLAHEVAHIARSDFAVGLTGRLGLALHFYHPLVHWLVARLQLQQELAADAEAARFAGGRREYMLALSRLALNAHKSRLPWPATAFLPTRGHLIRRIHVLKEQMPRNDGTISAAARAAVVTLLVAAALCTAVLRGPATIHGAEAPAGADKNVSQPPHPVTKTVGAEPFDLSYLSPSAVGFLAVKPAAIAGLPACKAQLDNFNKLLAREFPAELPNMQSIEQAVIEYSVRPRDTSKKQMGRIMQGTCMLRTVEDFDWKKAMKAIFRRFYRTDLDLVEVRFNGHVYFKAAKSPFPRPFGPDSFYFPDGRTMVWDYEDNLKRVIGQAKRTGPLFVAGNDWRKVDGGLMALAVDTREQHWKLDVSPDSAAELPIAPLVQIPNRWVMAIDGSDSLTFRAIATCNSDVRTAASLAQIAEALLGRARVALGQPKEKSAGKDEAVDIEERARRLIIGFLKASVVQRQDLTVIIDATTHSDVDSLLALMLAVIAG